MLPRELATVYGSPGFKERQLRDFVEKTKGLVSRFMCFTCVNFGPLIE